MSGLGSGSREPLDELDQVILDQVRAVHELVDPPPADLNERSKFGLRLDDLDIELCRLYEDTLAGAGARSVEAVRTITFESESLTLMMTVSGDAAAGFRVEGWLAPPGPLDVELRLDDARRRVVADDGGRFVFEDVGQGLVQLVVRRGAGNAMVVTAPLVL
jgi:hypothetical protein